MYVFASTVGLHNAFNVLANTFQENIYFKLSVSNGTTKFVRELEVSNFGERIHTRV